MPVATGARPLPTGPGLPVAGGDAICRTLAADATAGGTGGAIRCRLAGGAGSGRVAFAAGTMAVATRIPACAGAANGYGDPVVSREPVGPWASGARARIDRRRLRTMRARGNGNDGFRGRFDRATGVAGG